MLPSISAKDCVLGRGAWIKEFFFFSKVINKKRVLSQLVKAYWLYDYMVLTTIAQLVKTLD